MYFEAYLKDRTMNPLNNCVGASFYPASSQEIAELIALTLWQDQLGEGSHCFTLVREIETSWSGPVLVDLHEEEMDV